MMGGRLGGFAPGAPSSYVYGPAAAYLREGNVPGKSTVHVERPFY